MLIEDHPDFGEPIHVRSVRFQHSEPTNDELGIVPWDGWRLLAVFVLGLALGAGFWLSVFAVIS